MTEERLAIPNALRRQVLVEAGHRCAIPTCRATTTELAHIVPWSKIREHRVENLIALCPNCHSRFDKGEIDRQAMLMYKHNLGLVNSRYGEAERRLLDQFARNPDAKVAQLDRAWDFEFMYLLQDGLIVKLPWRGGMIVNGIQQGPQQYALTDAGAAFVAHLRDGTSLEDTGPHE